MSSELVVAAPVAAPAAPASTVTWRVLPARTPHVLRGCPRCGPAPFVSSDRFRVNASGRRLDVWLIYRCAGCDHTWNLTVHERTTPEALGPDLLEAYHRNDRALAWRCAFDAGLLGRAGARQEPSTPVQVERGPVPRGACRLRFELPFPVRARLDRLLAGELGVARARLRRIVRGEVDLRGPVRDGLIVDLELAAPGA